MNSYNLISMTYTQKYMLKRNSISLNELETRQKCQNRSVGEMNQKEWKGKKKMTFYNFTQGHKLNYKRGKLYLKTFRDLEAL